MKRLGFLAIWVGMAIGTAGFAAASTVEGGGYERPTGRPYVIELDLFDEYMRVDYMEVSDVLIVKVANDRGTHPTAEVIGSVGFNTPCRLLKTKRMAKQVIFTFLLGESTQKEGEHLCQANFHRNHPADEDGLGEVFLEFGFDDQD